MSDLTFTARAFQGKYVGDGRWIDITGEAKQYRITQEVIVDANSLRVEYKHVFFEEGTTVEGEFIFEFVSNSIFSTTLKGSVVGNGYVFGNYLHFNIRAGDIFVETSYQLLDQRIHTRGSSTSNAQGRFIAWSETLSPAP